MARLGTEKLSTKGGREAPAESPKRVAIVEAATRLFLTFGYDAVSMNGIAEAAAVSKPTVYSHFSNKETLFGAVMQRSSRRRFSLLVSRDDRLTGPPEEVLVAHGIDFVTLISSSEAIALFRVIIAEVSRHPKLGEVFYQNGPDMFCAQLSRYFEDQTAEGTLQIDCPMTAAFQFWELIKAPFHLKMLLGLAEEPDAATIAESVNATVTKFLKMYRAPA